MLVYMFDKIIFVGKYNKIYFNTTVKQTQMHIAYRKFLVLCISELLYKNQDRHIGNSIIIKDFNI